MTNGQVNFVHDLVQMAKAFEELPQVRAELEGISARNAELSETIQRLELRIIDLKQELDAAHAATRKAEVERDHAEQMFLETDDRLNAFQRLLRSFQADAGALVKAAEPAPSEQVSVPQAEAPTTPEAVAVPHGAGAGAWSGQGGVSAEFHGYVGNVDSVSSSPQGSREAGESSGAAETASSHTDQLMTGTAPVVETFNEPYSEGVSVQPDPTPASVSSSESAWPGSTPQSEPEVSQPDPTQATASSPAGDTPSPASAPIDAAASVADAPAAYAPQGPGMADDVGYHNEPQIAGGGWVAWDAWANRMNARYGIGRWPDHPTQAAQ